MLFEKKTSGLDEAKPAKIGVKTKKVSLFDLWSNSPSFRRKHQKKRTVTIRRGRLGAGRLGAGRLCAANYAPGLLGT